MRFTRYLGLWLGHSEADYRLETITNFKVAFTERTVSLGSVGLSLTYLQFFGVMVLLATLVCLIWWFVDRERFVTHAFCLAVACLFVPLFIFGLGSTYVSTFSEYEAVRLASFERYVNTVCLFLLMVEVVALVETVSERKVLGPAALMLLLVGAVALAPSDALRSIASRRSVQESIDKRAPYEAMVAKIIAHCSAGDHVFFISQGNNGFDFWVTRYGSRSVWVDNWPWSLGPALNEGDIYSEDPGPGAWLEGLREDGYSYVAIYRADDRLREGYAAAFADPNSIADEMVYRLDEASGLLEACV